MSHTIDEAISAGDITKIGVGLIVAVVVIGLVLTVVISAIIGRVIIVVIVIALGAFIWQQRSAVQDKINTYQHNACNFSATFFGVHLSAPDDLRQACLRQGHRQG